MLNVLKYGMGTQQRVSVGYGFQLLNEDELAKFYNIEDMWDYIENNYTNLAYSLVGNYWNASTVKAPMVTIEKLTYNQDSWDALTFSTVVDEDTDGFRELNEFKNAFNLKSAPQWFVWRYEG